jgi:hypothetical protein
MILTMIFVVLAAITLPGFSGYFYRAGAGHALFDIIESKNLHWDTLSEADRAVYLARAKPEGLKCAFLMALGQHIPVFLFVLITIWLLTRSISHRFRVFLRFVFFVVWVLGMLLLSFGVGYWGQSPQFPDSLGPVFLIYLALVGFFGMILGIGKLIQRATVKKAVEPSPVAKPEHPKETQNN